MNDKIKKSTVMHFILQKDFFILIMVLSMEFYFFHSIEGPRSTQGRQLQSEIVVREEEGVRNAYYEDIQNRYWPFKRTRFSLFHKVTILGRMLSEWNLLLIKGTQRECQ